MVQEIADVGLSAALLLQRALLHRQESLQLLRQGLVAILLAEACAAEGLASPSHCRWGQQREMTNISGSEGKGGGGFLRESRSDVGSHRTAGASCRGGGRAAPRRNTLRSLAGLITKDRGDPSTLCVWPDNLNRSNPGA